MTDRSDSSDRDPVTPPKPGVDIRHDDDLQHLAKRVRWLGEANPEDLIAHALRVDREQTMVTRDVVNPKVVLLWTRDEATKLWTFVYLEKP